MARKMEFEIEGAKALAVMHDDLTPKACDAIWERLPMEGMGISAKWACREVMLHLTGDMYLELEQEGPRGMFVEGDVGYALRGRTLLGPQKDYDPEFHRKLCEIIFFYGLTTGSPEDPGREMDRDQWELQPEMPKVVIFFAHQIRPIPRDFYLKCESIRHGRKKLTIRRYEE